MISVKAEDLQKALDPSAWPLRVKVREFINYSRRPGAAGNQKSGAGTARGQQGGQDQHQDRGHPGQPAGEQVQGQQVGEQRGHSPSFLAATKFALPGDEVPGGLRQDV